MIGVGEMGSYHARTLSAIPGVDVAVVADVRESSSRAMSDELGCEPSSDPMEVASRGDLDGVVIATPDETHPDLAVAAVETGMSVLCEKPLATTLTEAQRVIDAEVAIGHRAVQMGFMREYDPAHVQLLDAIAKIGTIDFVRAVHRNVNRVRRPLERIVVQSLVHEAHSIRFLTGAEITEVTAFGGGAEADSYRHVLARAALSNGGHASLEFDDGGFAYEVTVEVLGRDGDALTGSPTRAITRRDGSVNSCLGDDWFGWFADAYRRQDQAWVESIRSGTATGPSTWDGYVAQVTVAATMASLTERRTVPVELPEPPAIYRN